MPIWLRNFTFKKIQEFYEKEKEEQEKAMEKARGTQKLENSTPQISKPNIPQPTYQTKASKK